MAGGCCDPGAAASGGAERRVLWVVFMVNAAMFLVEGISGWGAQSVSLQADALDFLGDSINYATALYVLSRPLVWRATTALIKGLTMLAFGLFVLGATLYNALTGSSPEAPVMGVVGVLALLANLGPLCCCSASVVVTPIYAPSGCAAATTRSATLPSCWRPGVWR